MTEQDDLNAIAKELRAVVNGFKHEAFNGVICVPLNDEQGLPEWDGPKSRRWCARCKTRWARLFLVADRLDRFEAVGYESAESLEEMPKSQRPDPPPLVLEEPR